MSHLNLLLPFSVPPAEMAADLLRELRLPEFASLLSRTSTTSRSVLDPYAPALPHEFWLSHALGLTSELRQETSPPMAKAVLTESGMEIAPRAGWFLLQPSHLHVARDHLVLTDRRQLALGEAEARSLFDAARPLFEEVGLALHYVDAARWLLRADGWAGLKTSTPDAACGHNIDVWQPSGPGEREWRRLHNEVQMLWHAHSLNAEREMRGSKTVNALWLWGGSWSAAALPAAVATPGARMMRPQEFLHPVEQSFQTMPDNAILLLDDLIEPALGTDWAEWLARFHQLEATWFAPLRRALQDGQPKTIRLILSGDAVLTEHTRSRNPLRKLWGRPSLAQLAPSQAAA